MSTIRGYNQQNISADTGEVVVIAAPLISGFPPAPGTSEQLLHAKVRQKTNTPGDATFLCTVRWHDGNVVQEFNTALAAFDGNYSELPIADGGAWVDDSRDVTIQVTPIAGTTGSVDTLLIFKEL